MSRHDRAPRGVGGRRGRSVQGRPPRRGMDTHLVGEVETRMGVEDGVEWGGKASEGVLTPAGVCL